MKVNQNPLLILGLGGFLTLSGAALADSPTLNTSVNDQLGTYLVDGEGRSLYLFEADEDGTSHCKDACAGAWPPLLTDGNPKAMGDVDSGAISTVQRADGTTQVTYGGWPLYYFVKDSKPGDVNGQDVHGFGSEWYLVAPGGGKVE
ncbi:hypothetical protein EZI54_11335 [Marinobacter halodurans]|uniref:Lipoprotein with Yx(FWY)xxD motif n=1 Tax=Marinobacter halodurans TaxID=2528979 RepID=A0ABY1ZLZ2_9GAMM|nr:hypothetical protein [Marinobacter halodurans]TBW55754.1 hypothetical protein EZI54_11335 [Marinobacter halodurans]